MAIQKRATTVPLFFPPLFVTLENKVVNSSVATSLSSVPAVTRHVGERRGSLFRESAGNKARERGGEGGEPFVSHIKHEKAYTKDQRNMHDHIADGVFGKLHCRLLSPPHQYYHPLIVSLSYPINLLTSSLLAPVQMTKRRKEASQRHKTDGMIVFSIWGAL